MAVDGASDHADVGADDAFVTDVRSGLVGEKKLIDTHVLESQVTQENSRTISGYARSKAAGERVIAMVHGGNEYASKVDDNQRQWARWLAARGVVLTVGAHPHVTQREEIHGGSVILHSLGNAVYPRGLKGADSGVIRVMEIGGSALKSER